MTQNFPKLTTMTEVRNNSTETTTFSKLSARKMSKLKISAKANTPKRWFRSQKICDADIEVSAEAEVEVPLLRKLQNLSQCDRALRLWCGNSESLCCAPTVTLGAGPMSHCCPLLFSSTCRLGKRGSLEGPFSA